MAITIQDIARQLEVSTSTVSRVLNNKGQAFISEATRQRVLTAAKELGYRPNPVARALVNRRTEMIAVWVPRPYSSFYSQVMYQVGLYLEGQHLDILTKEVTHEDDPSYVMRIACLPVDGIIACDAVTSIRTLQNELPNLKQPIVGMGSSYVDSLDYVGTDNDEVAREAVRHLLQVGSTRVAHVMPARFINVSEWRSDAYQQVMQDAGQQPEVITYTEESRGTVRDTVTAYIRAHGCPDGIFCHNDDAAIGTYKALIDLGIKIPDDVALVGCDGIDEVEFLETPISTIVQPVKAMCEKAGEFLINRIADASLPPQQISLASRLEIRASSRR